MAILPAMLGGTHVDQVVSRSHPCPPALLLNRGRPAAERAGAASREGILMGGGMVVDLATGDGFVVVSLSGELDLSEATSLRNTLARLVQSNTPLIVVNAAELSFLDSSGIGVLVATANQQTASDAVLVI